MTPTSRRPGAGQGEPRDTTLLRRGRLEGVALVIGYDALRDACTIHTGPRQG